MLRFKNKISESFLTKLLIIINFFSLLFYIEIVFLLDIPFFMNVFMNMMSVMFLMKAISYSHVLYTVRFYHQVLNGEIKYDDYKLYQEVTPQNL